MGITKWDKKERRVKIVDIENFKANCVNPPEGVNSLEWIKSGFKGADC